MEANVKRGSTSLAVKVGFWYVVSTFLAKSSPGSKPIPLSDEEVAAMMAERAPVVMDVEVGDSVRVLTGPLEGFVGHVEEIDEDRQKLRVTVSFLGRDTTVDLDFTQVEKQEA